MRRIALIALAAMLLVAGAASASETSVAQFHNQTTHELVVTVHMRGVTFDRDLSPHNYTVFKEVASGSCARVRLKNDRELHNHCQDNGTPVRLACDLPAQFSCLVHAGTEKDLVVSIQHHPRR